MKFLIFFFSLSQLTYAATRVYEATAELDGKPVYLERHSVDSIGPRALKSTTLYTNTEGELIGKLDVNFRPSEVLPSFLVQDLVNELQWGLRREKGKLVLFRKDKNGERTRPVDDVSESLVLPSLPHYLRMHLNEIISKGEVSIKLLVPPRLESIPVRLKLKAMNKEVVEIELLVEDKLLSLFAPRSKFILNLADRAPITIEGVSFLLSSKGVPQRVDTHYR